MMHMRRATTAKQGLIAHDTCGLESSVRTAWTHDM